MLLALVAGLPRPGVADSTSGRLGVTCNVVTRLSVRVDADATLERTIARGVVADVAPARASAKPYVLVQRRAADATGPEVVVTVLADGGPTTGDFAAGPSSGPALADAPR
jgi:hypothetical protein